LAAVVVRLTHPMRIPLLALLCATVAAEARAGDADAVSGTWGYRLDHEHSARQGNFCNDPASALEVATIFERFGPRTGFSALSSSPACSTRVHAVTPRALLREVRVPLDSGGAYFVRFIQVDARDGSAPVLVTTRRLIR